MAKDMKSYIDKMGPAEEDDSDQPTNDDSDKPIELDAHDMAHLCEHGEHETESGHKLKIKPEDHAMMKPSIDVMHDHMDARLDDDGNAEDEGRENEAEDQANDDDEGEDSNENQQDPETEEDDEK